MKRLLLVIWRLLPLGPRLSHAAAWLLNQKFLFGVIGVAVDRRGRVLILKHSYRRREPWGLPAGWVKGAEQPAEALVREVREEVGLLVKPHGILDLAVAPDVGRIDIALLCSVDADLDEVRPQDAEIEQAGFFYPGHYPAQLSARHLQWIEQGLQRMGRPGGGPSES